MTFKTVSEDILIDVSKQVRDNILGLVGTKEGNLKFGRGAGGDISKKIDLVAEETVINTLKKKYNLRPTIIGEECGKIHGSDDGYLIMDAIDGTTNASRGLPFFCCSLAFALDFKLSSVISSCIINLSNGDIYHASNGNGSYFNNNKISVQQEDTNTDLNTSLNFSDLIIGTNVSGLSKPNLEKIETLLSITKHVRHFGANALELCYLAHGYLDAYVDIRNKIRITDMAAAYLIVKEAGGYMFSDTGLYLDSTLDLDERLSFIASSSKHIFNMIYDVLKKSD